VSTLTTATANALRDLSSCYDELLAYQGSAFPFSFMALFCSQEEGRLRELTHGPFRETQQLFELRAKQKAKIIVTRLQGLVASIAGSMTVFDSPNVIARMVKSIKTHEPRCNTILFADCLSLCEILALLLDLRNPNFHLWVSLNKRGLTELFKDYHRIERGQFEEYITLNIIAQRLASELNVRTGRSMSIMDITIHGMEPAPISMVLEQLFGAYEAYREVIMQDLKSGVVAVIPDHGYSLIKTDDKYKPAHTRLQEFGLTQLSAAIKFWRSN